MLPCGFGVLIGGSRGHRVEPGSERMCSISIRQSGLTMQQRSTVVGWSATQQHSSTAEHHPLEVWWQHADTGMLQPNQPLTPDLPVFAQPTPDT
jgi:hypothetical protein